MDISGKKLALIEWLARLQDESVLQLVEALKKKGSIKDGYHSRIPNSFEEIEKKLSRSDDDIIAGRIHVQEDVEAYFKSRFIK